MTDDPNITPETPEEAADASGGTTASRLALKHRAGGIAVPLVTAVVAFLMGGLVVLATGHNPLLAYRDIFNGPEVSFGANIRQGANSSFLAMVKGGRWTRVTNPLSF